MSNVLEEVSWSDLYAVVLEHQILGGNRVRWNARHKAWVGVRDFDRELDFPWKSEPGMTMGFEDRPSDDHYSAALRAIHAWKTELGRYGKCEKCGISDLSMHFVTPDVYGDPKIYCVQRPAYSVVDSKGGTGRVKHWGSPFGCRSVEVHIDRGTWSESPWWIRAAYPYGNPLTAEQAINRSWCTLCSRTAHNVKTNAAQRQEDLNEREYQSANLELGHLAQLLLKYKDNT